MLVNKNKKYNIDLSKLNKFATSEKPFAYPPFFFYLPSTNILFASNIPPTSDSQRWYSKGGGVKEGGGA